MRTSSPQFITPGRAAPQWALFAPKTPYQRDSTPALRSRSRLASTRTPRYNQRYEDGYLGTDEVFEKAEATAKRLKISRSELYSRALREFLDTHSPDQLTQAWDAVIEDLGQPDVSLSARTARDVFEKTEW